MTDRSFSTIATKSHGKRKARNIQTSTFAKYSLESVVQNTFQKHDSFMIEYLQKIGRELGVLAAFWK